LNYQVKLDIFHGPLDLLLRLIEKQELDITLVSLALVADQYLAHVARLQQVSAAELADFLAIAARLLLIKSRALLPPAVEQGEEKDEEDWGQDLVERLKEYRRFRALATALRQMEERGYAAFARMAPPPDLPPEIKRGKISAETLAAAYRKVAQSPQGFTPVDRVVAPLVVRITDCIRHILRVVRKAQKVAFSRITRRAQSRLEVIVTFLAMLELVKQQRLQVEQPRLFGEIYLQATVPESDEQA